MSLKLITFIIADPLKAVACQNEIMADSHLKLTASTYLISTSKNIDIMRRELSHYLDKPDELFICKLRAGDWISFHLGAREKWIEENI